MPFFPEVSDRVPFEGKNSRNPLAFRFYDKNKQVGQKTMGEHLRFAVCYWHALRGSGQDPFGAPTMLHPWEAADDPIQRAKDTMEAAFELFGKLGVDYWCFHDRDIAPEASTFGESCKNLDLMVEYALEKQKQTGIRLLWGTANLFSNPRYQAGAATNPDPEVFAHAAAQVKHAIEATMALGGQGYVFWGGREGYDTLLNTNMKQEREQFAKLLHMSVDYCQKIGFNGQLYIEPKPKEPTKHQYDSDAAACLNFLREFDLLNHLKLNLETNHATLAGHSMVHELRTAREAGALGSVDANAGDELLGWDTDQFPTNVYLTTEIMLEILEMGGFTTGGLNFDAKVRRQSHEPVDLLYAHIGGMDSFARGLGIAHSIREDGRLASFIAERYMGWKEPFGRSILEGKIALEECEARVLEKGDPRRYSGRQEMLENLMNEFVL